LEAGLILLSGKILLKLIYFDLSIKYMVKEIEYRCVIKATCPMDMKLEELYKFLRDIDGIYKILQSSLERGKPIVRESFWYPKPKKKLKIISIRYGSELYLELMGGLAVQVMAALVQVFLSEKVKELFSKHLEKRKLRKTVKNILLQYSDLEAFIEIEKLARMHGLDYYELLDQMDPELRRIIQSRLMKKDTPSYVI